MQVIQFDKSACAVLHTAARSRHGSSSPPDCHSLPLGRCAMFRMTLKTHCIKGVSLLSELSRFFRCLLDESAQRGYNVSYKNAKKREDPLK